MQRAGSLRRRFRKSAAYVLHLALDCAIQDRRALAGCDPENRTEHLRDANMIRELMAELFGDSQTTPERMVKALGGKMTSIMEIKKAVQSLDAENRRSSPTGL
jgi:hypothetical protein